MHILEIPSFFTPLGGEFCLEQAKALMRIGHEVRVISCNKLDVTLSIKRYITARYGVWEEKIDGVEFIRSNVRAVPKNIPLNQRRWCRDVVRLYNIYKEKHGKPDVLHAHCCLWGGVAARMISESEGIPYFITEHMSSGTYRFFGKNWSIHPEMKDLLREAYERCNCVIPVSEELTKNIEPFFGRNYRYKALSNIIDTDFFAYRPRENSDRRPYRYCCLAIGAIKLKGYDVLIEAFNKLINASASEYKDIPTVSASEYKDLRNSELHIAGSMTDSSEMKALIGDNPNVIVHGKLSKQEVRELLYQSDALVLASRSEAQPLVILEAMATGIPVVSTEVVPQCERIAGACLIAPIGDADALSKKMIEVRAIAPSETIADATRKICSPTAVAKQIEAVFCESKK